MPQIDDASRARKEVATKIVQYLTSPQAAENFTATYLEQSLKAVGVSDEPDGTAKLNSIVEDFLSTLGQQSIEALNDEKTIELSKSIARCIISQVDPIGKTLLTYDAAQHQAALANFKKLDQSKFDIEGVSLGSDISNALVENTAILNTNNTLNPRMVETILITQMLKPEEIGNKKQIITALAAGMIAKTAGLQTPFQEHLNKTASLPANVTNAILSAAVEIAHKPEFANLTAEQAMALGKQIGKNARDDLYQNRSGEPERLKTAITSRSQQSYIESMVPRTLLDKLAHNIGLSPRTQAVGKAPAEHKKQAPGQLSRG